MKPMKPMTKDQTYTDRRTALIERLADAYRTGADIEPITSEIADLSAMYHESAADLIAIATGMIEQAAEQAKKEPTS